MSHWKKSSQAVILKYLPHVRIRCSKIKYKHLKEKKKKSH